MKHNKQWSSGEAADRTSKFLPGGSLDEGGSRSADTEPAPVESSTPEIFHETTGSSSINSIEKVVEALCDPRSYETVYYRDIHNVSMPSLQTLRQIVDKLRQVLFPGYFGDSELRPETMSFYIGAAVDQISRLLYEQFSNSFCVVCFHDDKEHCGRCSRKAKQSVDHFIALLPVIRRKLASDVRAAYLGDPSCKGMDEAIYCFPSIRALTSYRIAHEMYRLDIPLIPRIITELAHSETGIDIHPGAEIGESFFIDHGTGTVIGETAVIGKNVRLYQGVTLGAKSFPVDKKGNPIKGIARHPIVEDDVIIYSGATILGRVTIGRGSIIGGNVWITADVASGSRVLQQPPGRSFFENGGGI